MAAALDNDFKIFLTNIFGFNDTNRSHIAREGYINSYTFVDWGFKHIKNLCDGVSKRRLNAVGCIWVKLFAKILKGFKYWVNHTNLRVIPV